MMTIKQGSHYIDAEVPFGDVWDAQKDMLLAGIGAIVAMMIVLVINLWLNANARREIRDSLRVRQDDHPLGEELLEEWLEKEKR